MLFISNIVIIIAIVLIVILLFIIVNKLSKENLNNNLNFSELTDNYKNLNEKFTKIKEEIEDFKINTEERELKFKHKILDGIIGGYKDTQSEGHFLKAKNEDELKKLYGIELEKDSYDGTFHTKIDKNSIKSFKTEIGEKFSIEKNNYNSSFYETRIIDTSHISLSGLYSGEVFLKKNDDFYEYENFTIEQTSSLKKLLKFLLKTYKINFKNVLGHSDISPNRKKDPGEKFPWEFLSKNKLAQWHGLNKDKLISKRNQSLTIKEKKEFLVNLYKLGYSRIENIKIKQNNKFLTKSFQRRFRQDLVNGIVDKECLLIIRDLASKR